MSSWYRTVGGELIAEVDPYSKEATAILNELEPFIMDCDEPLSIIPTTKGAYMFFKRCRNPAVRVAILQGVDYKHDGKSLSVFVGLCERHKRMHMWTNADTVWGWA